MLGNGCRRCVSRLRCCVGTTTMRTPCTSKKKGDTQYEKCDSFCTLSNAAHHCKCAPRGEHVQCKLAKSLVDRATAPPPRGPRTAPYQTESETRCSTDRDHHTHVSCHLAVCATATCSILSAAALHLATARAGALEGVGVGERAALGAAAAVRRAHPRAVAREERACGIESVAARAALVADVSVG